MALKLTRTASEILGDILLNTLQQNGLEKTDVLEQAFFDVFDQLGSIDNEQFGNTKSAAVDDFLVVYKKLETATTVLTIIHKSRLPQTLNV